MVARSFRGNFLVAFVFKAISQVILLSVTVLSSDDQVCMGFVS